MIKNILILILTVLLLLVAIISYINKEGIDEQEKISQNAQKTQFGTANKTLGDYYEQALQRLEYNDKKVNELTQKAEKIEQLIQDYEEELSTYTETQKAAFDKRLEKELKKQLSSLTMDYEKIIRQDYTQQMRRLIQKIQRINQADTLFQFQDSFLETQSRQQSPKMVIVPEDQYTMGYVKESDAIDSALLQKSLDETKIKVTLKRFAISQHEITVSNYVTFLNDIQHYHDFEYDYSVNSISYQGNIIVSSICDSAKQNNNANCGSGIIFDSNKQKWWIDNDKFNYPITSVSWHGAHAYTTWLSEKTGFTYRLPTEAEWEYAARADTHTLYWWGNQINTQNANFDPKNMIHTENEEFIYKRTLMPVDSLSPNLWGLYHVHGNASEWTCSPMDSSRIKNWQACVLSETRYIIRGGSWRNTANQLRATYRRAKPATIQENDLTFRVVREL